MKRLGILLNRLFVGIIPILRITGTVAGNHIQIQFLVCELFAPSGLPSQKVVQKSVVCGSYSVVQHILAVFPILRIQGTGHLPHLCFHFRIAGLAIDVCKCRILRFGIRIQLYVLKQEAFRLYIVFFFICGHRRLTQTDTPSYLYAEITATQKAYEEDNSQQDEYYLFTIHSHSSLLL